MIRPTQEVNQMVSQILIKCHLNAKHGPFKINDIRKHEQEDCSDLDEESSEPEIK